MLTKCLIQTNVLTLDFLMLLTILSLDLMNLWNVTNTHIRSIRMKNSIIPGYF